MAEKTEKAVSKSVKMYERSALLAIKFVSWFIINNSIVVLISDAGNVYFKPLIGNLLTRVYFYNLILISSGRLDLLIGSDDAIV